MSHIKSISLQTLAGIKDAFVYESIKVLRDALNQLIGLLSVEYSATTPGAINTDFTITHNLGRIPDSWLVVYKSAACDVYKSPAAATESTLVLRATVAGVNIRMVML